MELILKENPSTTHNLPNDRDRFFTSNLGKVSHLFKLSFKISPYMQQSINIQYYQRICTPKIHTNNHIVEFIAPPSNKIFCPTINPAY